MKKLLPLICAFLLVLTSCSNDNDDTVLTPILLTKVVITDPQGNTSTRNFVYTNQKIVSATDSNGDLINYEYNGDLISKITYTENGSSGFTEDYYSYDSSQKLIKVVTHYNYNTNSYAVKNEYSYLSNGDIEYVFKKGDFNSQNELLNTGKIYFNSVGEIIKKEEIGANGTVFSTTNYVYDNKKSTSINILGFNKIFLQGTGFNHNLVSSITNETNYTYGYTDQFQYNSNDFPSSSVLTTTDNEVYNYQYFYNQ